MPKDAKERRKQVPNKNGSGRSGRINAFNFNSKSSPLFSHNAMSIPKPIRGQVYPKREERFIDTAAGYVADTTGSITLLNGVAEGDDYTQRSGRGCLMKSICLTGFGNSTAATGLSQQHRVLIFWDNATNGVAPTIVQLLAASNTVAFPLVDNVNRFTIILDHKYVVGPQSAAIADQVIKGFEFNYQLNSYTQYSGVGATVASIQNGSLWMVTLGSNAAGGTAGLITIGTRLSFVDLD